MEYAEKREHAFNKEYFDNRFKAKKDADLLQDEQSKLKEGATDLKSISMNAKSKAE